MVIPPVVEATRLGQVMLAQEPLAGTVEVQYIVLNFALKAKAPPTTAKTARDISMIFIFLIIKVLFAIKKLKFSLEKGLLFSGGFRLTHLAYKGSARTKDKP